MRLFAPAPCPMSTSVPKSVPLARPVSRMPDKIGKYVVVKEVGRGSTGIVYLSHDAYYGRDVAIKVYNMETGGDEERARIARKMFLSEAHLVGMLQHPHILPIYDAGEENGHCYIVTEHVHGARTLAARSEEHTSELQSRLHLVCRLLLEKKKKNVRPLRPISTDYADIAIYSS